MKKWMIVAAVVYGSYWYVSNHFNFDDGLAYAHRHQYATWAPAVDYYIGVVYFQRTQPAKAQAALTQLVTDHSTGPYTAKGLQLLATAAQENRDFEVARQTLERFITEFPDHKDRGVAEKRLEIIKFK